MESKATGGYEWESRYAFSCPENHEAALGMDLRLRAKTSKRGKPIAKGTRYLYWLTLKDLDAALKKPFKETTKKDLDSFFASPRGRKGHEGEPRKSNWDKKCLKAFFRFLFNCRKGQTPELVEDLQIPRLIKERNPSELLQRSEVLRLVRATTCTRDACIIETLYESGCRLGELAGLKVGDVAFDEWGVVLGVDGKTGKRRIRLIESTPALKAWLQENPLRQKPAAALWLNRGSWANGTNQYTAEPLGRDGIGKVVEAAARNAEIGKKVHPHLFRHSRLTELAKVLSESELKVFAGWDGASDMPKTYVHLCGADLDAKLLAAAGKKPMPGTLEASPLQPKACPSCGKENSPSRTFCAWCAGGMEATTSQKDIVRLEEHLKNPRVFALLEKALLQALAEEKKQQ